MNFITQSFLKDIKKYLLGELCGHLVKYSWVDGNLLPPTKAMKAGIWFEFCLTGSLPKDGKIPVPEYMANGKEMMEPYRKAKHAADYIKGVMTSMGLVIIESGIKKTWGRFQGTIDIIAEASKDLVLGEIEIKKGERIVIDLKYSGLLDDWKSKHGWMWSDLQKEYHRIQAIHYSMVSKMRFFYWVTDSSHNEKDDSKQIMDPPFKIFHTPVSEFMIEQHIIEANELNAKFEFHKEIGFSPRPVFSECNKCILRSTCLDRALLPSVEIIDLNID